MINHYICLALGAFLGMVITLIACANAWGEAKTAHHKDAYNEYGRLTCEICKALAEKGASK